MPKKPLTFIDLFCGCGGFSLGLMRAGYQCLAAIDVDGVATQVFAENLSEFRHPDLKSARNVLKRDITNFPPKDLAKMIGRKRVDVIVGGPPCQGFSTARQVDGANHGKRLKHDERRYLFQHFLRYVEFFQPKVFVMENVLGLRTAAGGEYFTRVQKEARELGYRVHDQIEDAWELGVPQKRRRQLIIGVDNNLPGYFVPDLRPSPRANPHVLLGAAIGDLPVLHAGGGDNEREYDLVRRAKFIAKQGSVARRYLVDVLEIDFAAKLTNHLARPHSERDLRDFARLHEGENSATAMRDRGVKFEFPYDKSSFKDRYTRQSRLHPCSTIVAHLSKDGLMFIHPTQNRSITPREAARIQSFPDWFRFPTARTHAFRLVGNAVPPLISEAVGLAVRKFLAAKGTAVVKTASKQTRSNDGRSRFVSASLRSRRDVARELERLANLDRRALRALPAHDFLRGWYALLFLFPGLHPYNARDHGNAIEEVVTEQLGLPGFERLLTRRHIRSGWPVALELIGREALRRHDRHEISDGQLYCVEAQRGGIREGGKETLSLCGKERA